MLTEPSRPRQQVSGKPRTVPIPCLLGGRIPEAGHAPSTRHVINDVVQFNVTPKLPLDRRFVAASCKELCRADTPPVASHHSLLMGHSVSISRPLMRMLTDSHSVYF